jgi:hypothetical protein
MHTKSGIAVELYKKFSFSSQIPVLKRMFDSVYVSIMEVGSYNNGMTSIEMDNIPV